jgi:hypothetical protein
MEAYSPERGFCVDSTFAIAWSLLPLCGALFVAMHRGTRVSGASHSLLGDVTDRLWLFRQFGLHRVAPVAGGFGCLVLACAYAVLGCGWELNRVAD